MEKISETDESRRQMKISVRNLVEFVLRSGDIDNRRTSGAQKEAMQEGTRTVSYTHLWSAEPSGRDA